MPLLRSFLLSFLFLITNAIFIQRPAVADVLGDVMRTTARLGKQGADDVARLGSSRPGVVRIEGGAQRRLLGADFSNLDDVAKNARLTSRLDALRDLQAPVRQQLRTLPAAEQQVALAVGRGGEVLQQSVGDIATRGRIVREGGVPTLATIGTYGPEAAIEVRRLQVALAADEGVRVLAGVPRPRLEDFGKAMQRFGEGSWTFWRSYVTPNWKLLAGSGLVAAYLYNPEVFQDAAGNMTAYAVAEFTKLGIHVVEGAGRGVVNGTSEVVSNYGASHWAIFGIGFLLCSLMFRRVRYFVSQPLRWLNRLPAEAHSNKRNDNG